MTTRRSVLLVLLLLLLAACQRGATTDALPEDIEGPTVVIESPADGAEIPTGQEVEIVSTATDPGGVERIELYINNDLIAEDAVPEGEPQTEFTVLQRWVPVEPGSATVEVVAVNIQGMRSEPATITLQVTGEALGAPEVPEATVEAEPPLPTTEVQPTPEPPPPATGVGIPGRVNADDGLNVRAGPGIENEVIGGLQLGAQITAVARNAAGDWAKVQFGPGGQAGWVAAEFVTWDGDLQSLPQE